MWILIGFAKSHTCIVGFNIVYVHGFPVILQSDTMQTLGLCYSTPSGGIYNA